MSTTSDTLARLSAVQYGARDEYARSVAKDAIDEIKRLRAALATARADALAEAAESADQWGKTSDLLLRYGEMTRQELHIAIAVAGGIARSIRAFKWRR